MPVNLSSVAKSKPPPQLRGAFWPPKDAAYYKQRTYSAATETIPSVKEAKLVEQHINKLPNPPRWFAETKNVEDFDDLVTVSSSPGPGEATASLLQSSLVNTSSESTENNTLPVDITFASSTVMPASLDTYSGWTPHMAVVGIKMHMSEI